MASMFPFNRATYAGFLIQVYLLVFRQRFHGISYVGAGKGFPVSRRRFVKPAPVYQFKACVKKKEIRRTNCTVSLCRIL